MERFFEKISLEQFVKDTSLSKKEYDLYNLPKRSTSKSAGYDFECLFDFSLEPGEIKKIPLGIKVKMYDDDVLLLIIRSSLGVKYNIRMCNQVGVIDSDYYNNESNEGHIMITLKNEGTENIFFKRGDKICQGIFTKFYTVENEEEIKNKRKGGFGSTNGEL